jgi:TatD DNase family protein
MSSLFDTHTHLFDDRFTADLVAVIHRATAAGVVHMIAVGIDLASSVKSVEIARLFPEHVRAAAGMQPNDLIEAKPADWDAIAALCRDESVATIGETGLDRYWDKTPFAMQEDYFARHLALSRELGKPVVIHCREAEADVVRMLRDDFDRHGPVRAVMHSFTGDAATAQACLNMGLDISFAGMVTYKTGANLRDVAKMVPIDRLLIETDCPYLAPQPVRGKRNEPAFVVHTATTIALERGISLEALASATTANARRLFGIGTP